MFWFLRRKEQNPDKEVFENYRTNFGLLQQRRFLNFEEASFSTKIKRHTFTLSLWKANHFAWIPSALYKYHDFFLETSLAFEATNGYSAAGFVFRYINDENFYYFLISNHATFRLDVLFNGHLLPLIEWTRSTFIIPSQQNNLRIIAHGNNFSFYINDEWVAEIEDEKIECGRIGIAGQNYSDKEEAHFYYHSLQLESRPLEVEKQYWRWVHYIPADSNQRLLFAQTLMKTDNYAQAAVQLKKILKIDKDHQEARFFLALSEINLKLYDQALENLNLILSQNPKHKEASFEKANLLYLNNKFIEARDFINSIIADFSDSSLLWNVLGNCEYALGNWQKAIENYSKAIEIDDKVALFYANLARSFEHLSNKKETLKAYLKAAQLFFQQEAYEDLTLILPRIKAIAPTNPEVEGFEGKILYVENKKVEAKKIFQKILDTTYDSTIPYLYALLLIEEGKREEALRYFEKALKIDSNQALYWWRLAESKRLLGLSYQTELKKAVELSPEDPWVLNLVGLSLLDQNKPAEACPLFEKAHSLMPQEIEITINYSEALWQAGQQNQAKELIEKEIRKFEDPRLYNHLGNLLSREGNFEKAIDNYEQALRLDQINTVYLENCAAACLEVEMLSRAEELLIKAIDKKPSASAYNLLGNLTALRMEYLRAELCYNEALKLAPHDLKIKYNLAALQLERSQYEKAKNLINELCSLEPENKKIIELQQKLRKRFEIRFSCAKCGREWWVAKNIPLQQTGKIYGQPPPESPAGKCPICQKVYCIACAKDWLKDSRFTCNGCQEYLKLADEHLRYLVSEFLNQQEKEERV